MPDHVSDIKVTILLPTTGDRGPLLPYAVGSVLKQTESRWELYIIGDGVTVETKSQAEALAASDERIRFFDFPKDTSRGELNRHKLLCDEANSLIVCYLCDRDLYLPNHLEVMLELLEENDIGMTLPPPIMSRGKFLFAATKLDLSKAEARKYCSNGLLGMPLSLVGHRLEAYRRLPFGWRETPKGTFTDEYMWRQFLEQEWIRPSLAYTPTVKYLKRGPHPGLNTRDRVQLAREMFDLYCGDNGPELLQKELFKDLFAKLSQQYDEKGQRKQENEARFAVKLMSSSKNAYRWFVEQSGLRNEVEVRGTALEKQFSARMDLKRFQVSEDFYIDVFWKELPIGVGPALSVYLFGYEVLKFDCFGKDKGHFHVKSMVPEKNTDSRIFFYEESREAQIEHTLYELLHNLTYYQIRSPQKGVRDLTIDHRKLEQLIPTIRSLMLSYLKSIPRK